MIPLNAWIDTYLPAFATNERAWLAHCASMSKILSPGLRVGWMIAPSAPLANAAMCKQFSDAHTSNLTQATAAQYLTMGQPSNSTNLTEACFSGQN